MHETIILKFNLKLEIRFKNCASIGDSMENDMLQT